MARVSTTDGGYGGGAFVIHTDSSHSEYVSVPDADLLFRGDYHRAGPDLVLTGHDGRHHIVPGYFASEKHAALVAPNGASLSADVVDLLAGSPAPGQYAQAQPTTPPDSIGKVEKIVGDVTVVRNGVSVALHVGDAVFKSDVIVTGGDSSAGITFPDGTVLDLVANSRMALNEYSFEPNGANNGAVFTLVEGTFGFVAGQVAHDNHMSVVTPVATMGIRGTAGIVRHEFRANAGDLLYSFLVLDEIDIRRHGHHVGAYEVRDNRPDSPTFGEILQYIADSGYVTSVEAQGSGLPPIVTTEPITNSRLFTDRPILQDLVDSYSQFNGPGGIHSPGSGDSPNQLFGPQFLPENGGGNPINFIGFTPTGGTNNNAATTSFTTPLLPPETVQPVIALTTPTQTLVINTAGAITGVSVSETNSTSGETFTVTLTDNNGALSVNTSATGGGGTITSSNSGHTLTIVGTLSQVNADLTTLTDSDTTPGTDTITVTATDSLGHAAAPQAIDVTVVGLPVIAATTTQTIGINKATTIAVGAVTEIDAASGETFSVELKDSNGLLSATGATAASNGTTDLFINNVSLATLNSDLASLKDTNGTAGADNIAVTVTDSFGNVGTQTFDVTVAAAPVIAATTTQTIGINKATTIAVGAVTEIDAASGETFSVELKDSNGLLSATGATAASNGTTDLFINNVSLATLNSDLASLKDTNGTAGADNIAVTVTDSFGNVGTQTFDVTVAAAPVIAATTTQTIGINKATTIAVGAVTEIDAASGETFSVELKDSNGLLSATGATAASNGTTDLFINNVSLATLNSDLASLKDTNGTAGADNIAVTVTDSFGNVGTQTFDVTVAAAPVIAATTTQTIGINKATTIAVGAVTEIDAASGETFSVELKDSNGLLSATGATAASNGTTDLFINNVSLATLNSDLASLKDTNGTAGADNIAVTVTDSFGNVGTQTFDVTVAAAPVIAATTTQTIGINKATTIAVGAVTEIDAASGETFSVELKDSNGLLSATGATAASNGTTDLFINNVSLATLNSDLASLKDTNGTAGADNIAVTVTDSFGNVGTQTFDVTVAAAPVIAATTTQTIGINKATTIAVGAVTEIDAASGETFSVELKDSNGLLSATGATAASNGTTDLFINNVSLATLNSDLASLKDTNGTAGADNIAVTVTDSFGNVGTQTFDVTVAAAPVIAATTTQTIGINKATTIAVGAVTEIDAASGETFSVELKDSNGLLSATGATAASNGTTDLFINNVSLATLNSDLASLKDTNGTAGADNIAVTVTDSFGNVGTQTFDVTVAAAPVIAATTTQTIGINKATTIAVGAVTEIDAASGETFSVELKDSNGLLSATGATAASNGTTDLFINNVSLATLNSDLASLKDTNGTAGADNIAVTVTDSFGNVGTQTFDVTVAAAPVIAATTTQTIGINKATTIAVGAVTEIDAASGETFSVELKDSNGLLSATGATAASNGTTDLFINNVSLATLNSDLASLKDTNGTAGADNIAVTVTDSFGNVGTQTFDVTVAAAPVIAATTTQTIGINKATTIAVGAVTEIDAASGETFSVELKDSNGLLSATGATAASNGTTDLFINNVSLATLNSDLASLKDTNGTAGADNIAVTVTDSFGNVGTQTFDVTVAAAPVIAATTTQTIGINKATTIAVGAVTEIDAASGETFSVELKDSNGLLSATGATAASNGTTDLFINNVSLATLNSDLASLKDTNGTAGADNIAVTVTDSFGNVGTQTFDVTVAAAPVIAATTTQTIGINKATTIAVGAVTEIDAASGETFSVELKDSNGLLSATGATAASNGTTDLFINNVSLATLNSDLASLKDTNGTAGADNIAVTVTDSFGNVGTQTFDVTVAAAPVIAATTTQTIGINKATTIAVGAVTEIDAASGETFSVELKDSNGLLSATGATAASNGTTDLFINNVSLATLNSDLASLKDTNGTAGADNIAVTVTDSFGNVGTQTFDVTVAAAPVIAATTTQTIGINKATTIAVGAVTEIDAASGETFSVELKDSNGLLSATGATAASNGTTDLFINNVSLATLNSDLASLKDTNGTAGADNIAVTVTDSFGNVGTQTFDVTVAAAPVIAATTTQTIGINKATTIAVGAVTEIDAASGETFSVELKDSNGLLSATGATAASNGTTDLFINNVSLATLNSDLASLKDTNGTAGADNIAVTVTDSFGNVGTQTFDVTVAAAPVIAATTTQTIGINKATTIAVGAVTEIDAASGETFSVELKDSNGLLSATGATAASNGTTDLFINNVSLATLNSDLASLKDTNGTAGADNIAVTVTDSFGNVGTQTFDVTVAAAPVIAVPGAQTFDVNEATAITGVSLTESGSTTGEIFTVTLTDTHGVLSANTSLTGGGGTITSTNSGHTLTIVGTLGQAYSDLGTLTDTDATTGSDTITVNAKDSFGNSATQQTIAVTANRQNETPEPPTLKLGGTTTTVSEESTAKLPSITVTPVDSDDVLTLTIAGLPTGATITDSADGKVFSTSSFTLTKAEFDSTLTLNDGSNTGPFSLTVTANNTFPGEAASSQSQTINVTVNNGVGPAGVAGSAINLALTSPSAANGEPVAVTITGVPSDWTLNEGTNLGNGTWTVQTSDPSALTVLTAAAYTGAMVLHVTESWANADGSTGTATIADNVEAYAPGTPIFALSGNDTLTGAVGNNEFVFAQPIGNDTIYNFNVATDKIDLLGFAKIASFGDIQANIVEDSSGDAVITIGAGETITLHDVNAASLTAADFVFNQTPVVENAGNMVVSDGAVLPLSGTIDNTGTIALNSTGDQTELQIVGDGVTLQGGGQVTLSGAAVIIGTGAAAVLTNVDNTISGAGQIGSGDGTLTLINETHGTIDANVAAGTFTLETGTTITNNGVLEALNGGTLQILDPVTGSGSAIIEGGTMIFAAQSNMNVAFENGVGTPTYGELVLGDAAGFSGQISGFVGTAPDTAHSDAIDLEGINYNSSSFSETYDAAKGLLTVTDGSHSASLTFDNFDGTLSFASDGNGGTLITDPPATRSSNPSPSISVGGPGNDTFVFHPGIGADTITSFNPQADTIELDHFANIQNVQQLAALIGTDPHGDAVIELGHNDSITLPGVTQSYLQAHLQSLVHLG